MQVTLVAGEQNNQSRSQSRVPLQPGWNTLRLDLVEAAERLPLDEVREIRFSLPNVSEPVAVVFDDLLLADNRADLIGSSQDAASGLYVQQQGRHWNIGVAGRFELSFANGQIVRWFDLANDPHRLENLLDDMVLGPTPVVLPWESSSENGASPPNSDFAGLGERVAAHQSLLEANALRAMVECTWRFAGADLAANSDTPFHRWVYTVMADGRVYVHLRYATQTPTWKPDAMGLVASRRLTGSEVRREQSGDSWDYSCVTEQGGPAPGLLVVGETSADRWRSRTVGGKRAYLLIEPAELERPVAHWSGLLCLWPGIIVSHHSRR